MRDDDLPHAQRGGIAEHPASSSASFSTQRWRRIFGVVVGVELSGPTAGPRTSPWPSSETRRRFASAASV